MKKAKKGYTLIEVLIVVISIGALATLIIPRFTGQKERAYVAEAVAMLATLRQAQIAYYLEQTPNAYSTAIANLDVDTPASTKFTFTVDSAGASTATRTGATDSSFNTTIILDINGTWSGGHPLKPNN